MRQAIRKRFTAVLPVLPGTPRLWVMLFAGSLLAMGFFEVVDGVFEEAGARGALDFDLATSRFVQEFRTPLLTQLAIDITALGSASVLSVFAVVAYGVILGARDRVGFLHLTLAIVGAFAIPDLLKEYFERDRPDELLHLVSVRSMSFPSAHAFHAAAAYATFAFFSARFLPRSSEVFCYVLAGVIVLLIGLTRIYLGVHYPTDVLAGISGGGAWAFLLAAIFSHWYRKPRVRGSLHN